MFDYARKMKLAFADMARRVAVKAAAGVVLAVGLGFLLAALWTFLAVHLGWGSLAASGAIGGVFVAFGLGVIALAGRVRHSPPPASELADELQTRASMAARQAGEMAKAKTQALVGAAGQKAQGFLDEVGYRANSFAGNAEAKAQAFARNTLSDVATKVGITPEAVADVKQTADKLARSNLAAIGGLVGAFAVGVTLAKAIRGSGDDLDEGEFYEGEFYDED